MPTSFGPPANGAALPKRALTINKPTTTILHLDRAPRRKPQSKNKVISLPFRMADRVASTTAGAIMKVEAFGWNKNKIHLTATVIQSDEP